MPAITPSVFTPIHDEEAAYQASTSEHVIKKCIRNINLLGVLQPIGKIMVINVNQVGVQPLDPSVWQACDGSEITNPQSPLRSLGLFLNFTPNITDRYIKSAPAITGNSLGGSQSFALSHTHGGSTGGRSPGGPVLYEEDTGSGARRTGEDHTHAISSGIGNITIDYPQWLKVGAFLKIQ